MSTAAAPATPVTEPPPLDPSGAPTPEQKDAILKMFKPRGKVEMPKETPKEPVKEVVKAEVKTDPTEKKVEPAKVDEPNPNVEKNFAALRTKAEAAEAAAKAAADERDRLRAEYEEYKKKPAPEDVLKEMEALRKSRDEYQRELRTAALQRDPEFNAKYDTPIRSGMQQMVDILTASGIPKEDAVKAVPAWNKTQFAEWMDTMGPVEKLEFGAAMQQVVTLYGQKQAELENAEQTWQGLTKQREEASKAQQEAYRASLKADIAEALKEAAETPLGKEHADVLKEAQALVERAAGINGERLSNREMLGLISKSHLLATGFQKQSATLAERDAKIAELEKTLGERDAFIKEQHGSIPSPSGTKGEGTVDRKALAKSFLNPVIR